MDFNNRLRDHIESLSFDSSMQFALSICKRLFPDYQEFAIECKWGNTDLLLDAINACEKAMSGVIEPRSIQALQIQLGEVIPDTEDFPDCSYALNSACAILEALGFILDRGKRHLYNIAEFYTDTIYFRIHESLEAESDQIEYHETMLEARRYLLSLR